MCLRCLLLAGDIFTGGARGLTAISLLALKGGNVQLVKMLTLVDLLLKLAALDGHLYDVSLLD